MYWLEICVVWSSGWMRKLINAFSRSLIILKGWRIVGSVKEYTRRSEREKLDRFIEWMAEKKRFGCGEGKGKGQVRNACSLAQWQKPSITTYMKGGGFSEAKTKTKWGIKWQCFCNLLSLPLAFLFMVLISDKSYIYIYIYISSRCRVARPCASRCR